MCVDFENWIRAKNAQLRCEGVPPQEREGRLLKMYFEGKPTSNPFGYLGTTEAKIIHRWLQENTQYGEYSRQPLATGVFFYDVSFWTVRIPFVYGNPRILDITTALDMVEPLKTELCQNEQHRNEFLQHLALCIQLVAGIDSLHKDSVFPALASQFLMAAEAHINLATTNLLSAEPNASAVHASRMSVEIILKTALVARAGWDERRLTKKIGHKLDVAMDECTRLPEFAGLAQLRPLTGMFPEVGDRYSTPSRNRKTLWDSYQCAYRLLAATVEILAP